MIQWVLLSNGQIVPRRSLRHLQTEETNNNVAEEMKRQVFMECIRAKLGDSMSLPSEQLKEQVEGEYEFVPFEDDEEVPRTIPENEAMDARGKPIFQQSVCISHRCQENSKILLKVSVHQVLKNFTIP